MSNKDPIIIVQSQRLAKYLALNGIVWFEVKIDKYDQKRVIFIYKETQEVKDAIEQYKIEKEESNIKGVTKDARIFNGKSTTNT